MTLCVACRVAQAEALAQAGYKLAMVTTFGQPRFRSSSSPGSASGVLPLRVVSRTDPVYRLFPGSSGHHHGPELVLLPDLAFFYASPAPAPSPSPSSSSSTTSPSSASPPALPTSPLSRRAAGAKGKEKSARRDSEGGGKTAKEEKKKNKKDKKDNHRRDRSPSPEKKENRSPSPPTSPASALEAAAGEEDDVETSAEHRMESYLRNLKAKVRGTPYRAHLLT